MPDIVSGAEYATFINTFRCDPANQEEVIRINIDIVDQVASSFPGFIAAAVHRSIDGTRWSTTCSGNPPNTSPPCNAHPNSRRSPAASQG